MATLSDFNHIMFSTIALYQQLHLTVAKLDKMLIRRVIALAFGLSVLDYHRPCMLKLSLTTEKTSQEGDCRCNVKAFYSCPAIISRRPGSQNTSKESQLNSEKDSRRKQARSHVTLEKSS